MHLHASPPYANAIHPSNQCQIQYLDGGYGNAIGINGHDGTQQNLAQQRRHEDGPDGGGRREENRQRDITLSDVSAQGRRLQKAKRKAD